MTFRVFLSCSRKRLYFVPIGSRYEVGESSTARPTRGQGIDYGFIRQRQLPDDRPMTVGEVNTRVTELVELHEHDTQDLYALLEDAQDSRSRISQRVDMDSQRVDLLMGDRMTLHETVWMVHETHFQMQQADVMVDYALEKYGNNWNCEDEIADVILEDLWMKYEKYDKGKGKGKEAAHDQLKVNKYDKGKGKVHEEKKAKHADRGAQIS
ncbi:hypothetical protein Tco_0063973 [Tanacetum coccineum]